MVSILNNEKLKGIAKKTGCVLVAGALALTLVGCEREIATNANTSYDVIDTTSETSLENGVVQVLDVPRQNFKLVVSYKCELEDDERWTITSDKSINIEINTSGLPEGVEVYIDNIHTDTTICSHYPQVDGITQDTMDDRIHNSLMLGFPIADDVYYGGINQIEGQNETFIQGFVHGYNGYTNGSITEKRFLESDYLDKGVTSNKIKSIVDLIIIDGDKTSCVSVETEVKVNVWPFIQVQKSDGTVCYRYYYLSDDGDMRYDELSEDEFIIKTQIENKKIK